MRVSSSRSSRTIRMLRSHASAAFAPFSAATVRKSALSIAVLACPVGKLRRFMRRGNEDIARPGINVTPCYRTMATMDGPLIGGHVQRVGLSALGRHEVALLKVRIPPSPGASRGKNVHLVVAGGRGLIEGGHIVAVEKRGVAVAREGRIWRVGGGGAGVLALAEQPAPSPATEPQHEELLAWGTSMVEALVRAEVGGWRDSLRRALVKAIARLDRRIDAVRGDLTRTQGADVQAERARLFVAEAARAPRGATKLAAGGW